MADTNYTSDTQILEIAKATSGYRIEKFNINNRSLSKSNKGVIGQIIEEGVFHYPINSRAEADFANLGVELKVTGLKKIRKNNYVIKERLVLNIINYMNEFHIGFEDSSFWKKNSELLLMFYLYDDSRSDYNFLMIDSILHKFSDEDLIIIKKDWETIEKKINNGEADLISEADTMYLGACTKGANSISSYRQQPKSKTLAKQRAFCLKNSYMNSVVKRNFLGEKCKSILSLDEIKNSTFEIAINSRLRSFYGKTEDELYTILHVENNPKTKNKFNILVAAMLGINGSINNTDEFSKANISLKTVRIEENGTIQQHMSFPCYKYMKIIKEEWDSCEVKETLLTTKYMFVVFIKKSGKYTFEKIKFWNMDIKMIEEYVKPVWKLTVDCIKKGNIVKKDIGSKYYTNFPGPSYNSVFHTRPHDSKGIRNSKKGYKLPIPDKLTGLQYYTKYCFWLDKSLILKIISKN